MCLQKAWEEWVEKEKMQDKTGLEITNHVLFGMKVGQRYRDYTWGSLRYLLQAVFSKHDKHVHYPSEDDVGDRFRKCGCKKFVPDSMKTCPWCYKKESEYDCEAVKEQIEKADKKIAEVREEAEKQIAEAREEAEKQIAKAQEEAKKQIAKAQEEAKKQIAKAQEDTEKQIAKAQEDTEKPIECPVCKESAHGLHMHVLIPCGHCVCVGCIGNMKKINNKNECPVCRVTYNQTHRLFL